MHEELAQAARRGIVTTRDAERRGLSGRDLRRAAETEELVRVRRDAYVASDVWRSADRVQQHLVRVEATGRAHPHAVFSHESAAVVWGLPLVGFPPDAVQVLGAYGGGGRAYAGAVHRSTTDELDVVVRRGIRVTTCARTVVDLARVRPFVTGLAAADHALHARLVTLDGLREAAQAVGRRRGARAARHVVAHATGLAESAGESLSRARMVELGVLLPELQVDLRDDRGVIGRVDFWWPTLALVGEFDGRVKYARDGVADPRAPEDRLWDEKLREDRLRATGARVVRWTWSDAWDPARLLSILTTAGVPRVT